MQPLKARKAGGKVKGQLIFRLSTPRIALNLDKERIEEYTKTAYRISLGFHLGLEGMGAVLDRKGNPATTAEVSHPSIQKLDQRCRAWAADLFFMPELAMAKDASRHLG